MALWSFVLSTDTTGSGVILAILATLIPVEGLADLLEGLSVTKMTSAERMIMATTEYLLTLGNRNHIQQPRLGGLLLQVIQYVIANH